MTPPILTQLLLVLGEHVGVEVGVRSRRDVLSQLRDHEGHLARLQVEERRLVGDLTQVCRQRGGHAVKLELGAPDVGGDFDEAVLLRWRREKKMRR